DVAAWSITEDGRELPRALLGVPLPVDPGAREIRVSAPGFEPWSTRVIIPDAGGVTRVRVPALAAATPAAAAAAAAAPPRSPRPAPPGVAPEPASGAGALRVLSFAGVGLGAAGLGVAAVYGILARGRYDDAVGECPAGECSPRGHRLRRSGERHGTVATVSAVSGAVLMASGISLWIAMPTGADRDARDATTVGLAPLGSDGLGVNLEGVF